MYSAALLPAPDVDVVDDSGGVRGDDDVPDDPTRKLFIIRFLILVLFSSLGQNWASEQVSEAVPQ